MSTGFSGFSSGCALESSWLSGCGLCSAWVHPTRSRWLYPRNLVLPTVPTLFPAKLEYLLQLDEICYLWKALPRGRPLWCKQKRHTWLLSLSLSYRIIIYEYPLVEHNQEKKNFFISLPPTKKKRIPWSTVANPWLQGFNHRLAAQQITFSTEAHDPCLAGFGCLKLEAWIQAGSKND